MYFFIKDQLDSNTYCYYHSEHVLTIRKKKVIWPIEKGDFVLNLNAFYFKKHLLAMKEIKGMLKLPERHNGLSIKIDAESKNIF